MISDSQANPRACHTRMYWKCYAHAASNAVPSSSRWPACEQNVLANIEKLVREQS
jgi:hypothetical protein